MTDLSKYHGELVYVAPVEAIRSHCPGLFQGDAFTTEYDCSEVMLYSLGRFMSRDEAEEDPAFKQFIPYALIVRGGKVLIYTRGKVGAERRLHAKRSIGVGGHINPRDVEHGAHLTSGFGLALFRELEEEIGVKSSDILRARFAGLVNEDSAEVGRVHLGLVYIVEIEPEAQLSFENCLVDPKFLTLEELRNTEIHADLEGWSQLIVRSADEVLGISSDPVSERDPVVAVANGGEVTLGKVRSILVELLGVNHSDLPEDALLVEGFGVDSLDYVEIVMAVEEEFGIEIQDDEAEKLKTVGDIVILVDSKLQ